MDKTLIYRGSGSDLATDIKRMLPPGEIARLLAEFGPAPSPSDVALVEAACLAAVQDDHYDGLNGTSKALEDAKAAIFTRLSTPLAPTGLKFADLVEAHQNAVFSWDGHGRGAQAVIDAREALFTAFVRCASAESLSRWWCQSCSTCRESRMVAGDMLCAHCGHVIASYLQKSSKVEEKPIQNIPRAGAASPGAGTQPAIKDVIDQLTELGEDICSEHCDFDSDSGEYENHHCSWCEQVSRIREILRRPAPQASPTPAPTTNNEGT